MKYKVIISDVPTRLKLGKLAQMISLMMSIPNHDFLVQLMPSEDIMREVVVSFRSYSEAYLAHEMLDNFIYKEKKITSVFKATMHKDNQQPPPKTNFRSHNRQPTVQEEGHQRNKSQSPHSPVASNDLDMRIELLKKHTKVLDEQRKLLVEQKKLDVLKMRSFKNNYKTKSLDAPIDPEKSSIKNACGLIMKSLMPLIYKYASLEEHSPLKQHTSAIVMERMAVLVAANDDDDITTRKVMALYRLAYPTVENEEFVKTALQDVKICLSSTPPATISAPPEGGDANKVDGTEKAAGDHHNKEGQATAKDTTSQGDSDVSESISDNATENTDMKSEEQNSMKTAIRLIMKNMRIYMIIHSSPKIRELLVEYVYFTLKQRLDPLVADTPKCLPHNIMSLYESHYPRNKDEEFIKQLINDINEDRVPEEIVIKAKQRKPFNTTLQEGAVKSGQTGKNMANSSETEKGKDVSANTKNEDNVDDKDEMTSQSPMEIRADVNNVEKGNDKLENNSLINDASDATDKGKDAFANTKIQIKSESTMEIGSDLMNAEKAVVSDENEIKKNNDNFSAGGNSQIDFVVTEATQKSSDNMELNKYNRGVKRKNEEKESDSVKEHKSDHIVVIDAENTNEN